MKVLGNALHKFWALFGLEFNKRWFRLWIIFFFFIVYMMTFMWLESLEPANLHIIHCVIDDYIPVVPVFIFPYLAWFPLIGITMAFYAFFQKNDTEFRCYVSMVVLGIIFFVIICLVWPNGLELRPDVSGPGFFNWALRTLYSNDTPTNVFPSLHVYQTLVAVVPTWRLYRKKHPVLTWFVVVLAVLICLSTVFLKQHSIIDAVAGVVFAAIFYWISYYVFPFRRREAAQVQTEA
ncbi:MAG: phosphatase PAP2 family protein [Lachnospiraceae bacterium]|nr:phosphatase PAP2 family protein [Lachnospiraceae bacterium]